MTVTVHEVSEPFLLDFLEPVARSRCLPGIARSDPHGAWGRPARGVVGQHPLDAVGVNAAADLLLRLLLY